jgi:uncharacterized protein YuzE
MGNELRIAYDKEADVLDVSLGEPRAAVSREVEDDLFLRFDLGTDEMVGFCLINFSRWFHNVGDFKVLPIVADLALSDTLRDRE